MAGKKTALAGLAARYAAALFDLAEDGELLDAIAQELRALGALIEGSRDLDRLVRAPLLKREAKERAIEEVLARAGAHPLVRRFVAIVARNGRLAALPAIIDSFQTLLAARRGEVTAIVVSARPLAAAEGSAIEAALGQAAGVGQTGRVTVDARTDPSLLGGMVVRLGSRMIDSSLKSKLARLQLAMKEA